MRNRFGLLRIGVEVALLVWIFVLLAHRPASPPPPTPPTDGPIFSVPTKEKVVALTFDDGPHPEFTPRILDILDKYHVKATFFMIGERMAAYPDIVQRTVAAGHVIGNHTYTHPPSLELEDSREVIRELEKCEEEIEALTGARTKLFRPPRGLVNGAELTVADEEGYRTILWAVCADHHDAPTPALMAERVLTRARPGAIILAHDGFYPSRIKDVEATPLIIEGLKKQGYRFVTVPELLALGEPARR